jgi:hypothetical protein
MADAPGIGKARETIEPSARLFTIALARQPEGVWLATSDDNTAEEVREEAFSWGRELLADNLGYDFSQRTVFVFGERAKARCARS